MPENLPIPQIRDIFDRISGTNWISTFDLASAYFQCVMDDDSRKFTSFCTRTNKYEFNRLPFGLRSAVSHFCKLINMVIGNLECCLSYVDDIICFSQSFEQHCIAMKKCLKL